MAKEWILNMATNRWGLNKKNSVGPVSQWIRECRPKTIKEWEEFSNSVFTNPWDIERPRKYTCSQGQCEPKSWSNLPQNPLFVLTLRFL